MPRLLHGRVDVTEETVREAREAVAERVAENPLAFATVKRVEFERRFDFLFLELQDDPDSLLPVARKTRDALVALGRAMADDGTDDPAGDTQKLSAAYTYFGQFVDHDITLEKSGQPGMRRSGTTSSPKRRSSAMADVSGRSAARSWRRSWSGSSGAARTRYWPRGAPGSRTCPAPSRAGPSRTCLGSPGSSTETTVSLRAHRQAPGHLTAGSLAPEASPVLSMMSFPLRARLER
jgi:hypothetical protein